MYIYIEPKAHNRINFAIVQALWWEYGSQMGCDDEGKIKNKLDFKKLIIVCEWSHLN